MATAQDNRGVTSNTARAIVMIEDDLLTSRSFILGRVMLGNCELDQPETGNLQVRLQSRVDNNDVVQEGSWGASINVGGTHAIQIDALDA